MNRLISQAPVQSRNFLDYTMYICMLIIATAFVVCAFWLLKPYKTLVVNNVKVVTPVVRPGDAFAYRIKYCKYIDVQAVLFRQLVNGANHYATPPVIGNVAVAPGCGEYLNNNTLIPLGTPPGNYYLDIAATYQVNPIRKVTYRYQTPPFRITE